jgi:hypothetical protein
MKIKKILIKKLNFYKKRFLNIYQEQGPQAPVIYHIPNKSF